MAITVFGIRHHGPGCARSLRKALDELRPDVVLVEGPPDADAELAAVTAAGMQPPVALLVYRPDDPQRASFYPFAEFSPEWQALRWAGEHGVPARFCDLPCALRLGTTTDEEVAPTATDDANARRDPLQWLATADGYSDSERWWNDRIEESPSDRQLFRAILEAVTAVRQELALVETTTTLRREAWMRRTMRAAQKDGFAEIAVVCGAWHAPALTLTTSTKAADDALLQGLDKVKVRATWVPWTHARLTSASGYGAGITSPGWYEHLWRGGDDIVASWLVRAARVLRGQDLQASSASVIEAVRLAEALAGLRGRPLPGLPETLQSIRAVFGGGDDTWLALLQHELLIGTALGEVPPGVARLPLDDDLQAQQKSLRLKPTASPTTVELDLREPGGQARSVFLHRLLALRLPWGTRGDAGRTRGTFKEVWSLQWQPEFALAIVDASAFGNTVAAAAGNRLIHTCASAATLAELVALLEHALLADLPAAGDAVLAAVQARSASTSDVAALLAAIPPLSRVSRYGNVRESDLDAVRAIVRGLTARVHAALPGACSGLADDAAQTLTDQLREHHAALALFAEEPLLTSERETLQRLAAQSTADAQLRGLATRLLRDAGALAPDVVAHTLTRELSAGTAPWTAARWLDGFLAGAGALLAHDRVLLQTIDAWVAQLGDEHFQLVLPLVRRTLGSFHAPERRQIALALRSQRSGAPAAAAADAFALDDHRAGPAVQAVLRLLGLPTTEATP